MWYVACNLKIYWLKERWELIISWHMESTQWSRCGIHIWTFEKTKFFTQITIHINKDKSQYKIKPMSSVNFLTIVNF